MSTLFIPLSLAALGIVLRGSGFAFHKPARRFGDRRLAERLFGVSSVLTPFFMGTVVGAIASGRVPVGNAAGDPVTSWLNGVSILTGVLFVATCAYLAAVFLVSDARRAGDPDLERYFATRALGAGGGRRRSRGRRAVRLPGRRPLHLRRARGRRAAAGDRLGPVRAGVLVLLWRGHRRGTRALAVGAVVAVIWGWGVAQYPYLLPKSLTITEGAGNDTTMEAILIVFVAAVLIVIPSLAFLYTLSQRSISRPSRRPRVQGPQARTPDDRRAGHRRAPGRHALRARRRDRGCVRPRRGDGGLLAHI